MICRYVGAVNPNPSRPEDPQISVDCTDAKFALPLACTPLIFSKSGRPGSMEIMGNEKLLLIVSESVILKQCWIRCVL